MNKAIIITVEKQKIVYQNKSVTRKMSLVWSLSIFVAIVACFSCIKVMNHHITNQLFEIAEAVYNPIHPLFSDSSDIGFASSTNVITLKNTTDVKLSIPMRATSIETKSDHLEFLSNSSIMVLSPEDGVVQVIDEENGEKYIIIKHSSSISTKLKGVDIIGVSVGQIVKQGQELATTKQGAIISMFVLENNMILQNIKVNNQFVEWEA